MSRRKSFRKFIGSVGTVGSVSAGEFHLGFRDAYEHYKYIWDTLRWRKGGAWNLWRRMGALVLGA